MDLLLSIFQSSPELRLFLLRARRKVNLDVCVVVRLLRSETLDRANRDFRWNQHSLNPTPDRVTGDSQKREHLRQQNWRARVL